jgi:hypothetical protein
MYAACERFEDISGENSGEIAAADRIDTDRRLRP